METLPSILAVHKDKAHASRRLCSRGWGADPYLKAVHSSVVSSTGFIQKIQNSKQLQQAFAERIAVENRKMVKAGAKDLGACKPRFEVSQKPYLRRVLHYEALLATAAVVVRGRSGRVEAKAAQLFIQEENEERALQAAMLADAGEECLELVRAFEPEDLDSSAISEIISRHLEKIHMLFEDNGCLQVGVTATMLNILSEEMVVPLPAGRSKSIGGPGRVTAAIQQRCLDRMRGWVKLSTQIAKAEFPEYELLQALSPLNLQEASARTCNAHQAGRRAEHVQNLLDRMAQVLRISKTELCSEYFDVLPAALAAFRTGKDMATPRV